MGWHGRKVLVTGGAGFLGSNLCHALAERGARVTALDGFLFGGGANPANLADAAVELVRGDVRELDLRSLCEGASVIFNLAAQTSHMGGQTDPLSDIAVNAVAQVRLIHAARAEAPDPVAVDASRGSSTAGWALLVDENQPVARPTPTACRGLRQHWRWSTGCGGRWSRCGLPALRPARIPRRSADVSGHLDRYCAGGAVRVWGGRSCAT